MTKHYYLTQEEALEIAEPFGHNILSIKADIMFTKEDLADCINAALDKVLGEPKFCFCKRNKWQDSNGEN